MDSIINKTQLAEKRFEDKQIKEDHKLYNNHLQKTKETTKLQKKQYELIKKLVLTRKQRQSNKKLKPYERKPKREKNYLTILI